MNNIPPRPGKSDFKDALSGFPTGVTISLGGNVAAVTAVRQASIPFAVLIGGILLSEVAMPRRLVFSLDIAIGIVIIVFAN